MAGNSLGTFFRITTFGESHGRAVGVVIDGCPAGMPLSEEDVQPELDRRKPGQSSITTPRNESDRIEIFSGVFEGKTTGAPIMIMARNQDFKPEDYLAFRDVYRPGHADYTYDVKYGFRDWRGSGRASARETLARVAAGAVAKKYLRERGVEILSFVEQVGDIRAEVDINSVSLKQIDASIARCPDEKASALMIALIEKVKTEGDSIGGVVRGMVKGLPAGLGEPVFDKLHADLGKAMLSINAAKGFEIGSGFAGTRLRGSEHNDEFVVDGQGRVGTRTNHAGGVLGGISSGEPLLFRVAFKPVSTIAKEQRTINASRESVTLKAAGRHDPCVLPRAVPIVDAMAALVVMDHCLRGDF